MSTQTLVAALGKLSTSWGRSHVVYPRLCREMEMPRVEESEHFSEVGLNDSLNDHEREESDSKVDLDRFHLGELMKPSDTEDEEDEELVGGGIVGGEELDGATGWTGRRWRRRCLTMTKNSTATARYERRPPPPGRPLRTPLPGRLSMASNHLESVKLTGKSFTLVEYLRFEDSPTSRAISGTECIRDQ